jgi:DNA mismatch repair protein MutL
MRYAIAYPTIRFLLLHNNKPVLDLMKEKTLQSRISSLFKKDIVQNLMQFDDQDEYMQLQGFIAHPQFSTASQSKQYIMVNNRPVFDKSLSTIVKKAYSGLLANNRYPIFVLSITLPHEAVDVNVHPRKEAVSFMSRDSVNDFITNTIKKTLGNHDLRHGLPLASTMQYRTGSTHSETADMLKESSALWNVKDEKEQLSVESIQQFHKTYLVCTTSKNVVIIDQHAAHERILYEQLITTYKKHSHKNIELENDFLLDISDNEAEILQMNKDMLLQSGFKFIKKGEEWYLREVPVLFKKRDFNLLIHELLDNVHETDSVSIDSITHTMITYLACRNAVKAGDILTEKEAKRLVEKLAVTKNNTTCPHGRPTTIKLLSQDLAKWFGRS